MTDANASPPPRDQDLTPSSIDFPVVGIGASAGGIPALQTFFEALPAGCGMAFVVVLHLSPRHASNLAAVLQTVTSMPVSCPEGPVSIERDHVYVIGPNRALAMNDSYISVSELGRTRGRQATVDLFFRTLAVVHRERAFAIVLSGTGSDGAVGITRIREEGGVSFAQLPQEAEFDGMPRAAIATGAVDWVLPVAEMPAKLVELWANACSMQLPVDAEAEAEMPLAQPPTGEALKEAEEALREVLVMLRTRTGHDFRNYKRATVLRRIERRMQVSVVPSLPAYRAYMQAHPDEAHALLKDLLIGVTNFFRDAEAFEALQRDVVPGLVEGAANAPDGLRVWVPGCSTGEEAYSVAILLCEQANRAPHPPDLHLFATDIDEAAIGVARLGIYPSAIDADVSPTRLRRYFDKEGLQYRIRKEVREKVMFASHDILRDPPFSKLDLISCRNLLIYLNRDVHTEILEMFHFALKPGGYLFLGSSESADTSSHLFSVVDKKNRIYRANLVARPTRYVPTLPMGAAYARPAQGAAQPPARKAALTIAELHQRLAEQHAPPSVLIDRDGSIVHISGQAGRFLHYAPGAPSHDLLSVVDPELRLELRTAIFQAARSGKSVEARRVHVTREGRGRYVTMIVRPVQEADAANPLSMVLFQEVEDSTSPETKAKDAEGRDPLVAQLEDELRRVKEQLQSTIEQSETSNEELKASNEELQAINEELRSTTEELETSKEELQSINEELVTVNHELKSKVEETGKINDDLQNLIASTDIATVFVDRAMSIKRYTPHATQLFNLIPTDVGRSLLDITHRLDYEALADDAAEAFQSLRMIEREVTSQDGKWYLARVLPYRTTEDRIDGAVLTFVDITGRRKAEESMRLVAESTKDYAIVTFDAGGAVTFWNRGAERLFGYGEAEALGRPVSMVYTPEDVAAGEPAREMAQARSSGRHEEARWHLRKDGSRLHCSSITTPLVEDGQLRGFGRISREPAADRATAEGAPGREFFALLSHELKNPLNLIQLSAELLLRTPGARELPQVVRAAETIRRTVLGQAQLIDDLLDLSRLQSGRLPLHRGPVDWVATVRTVAQTLEPDASARGIGWRVQLPDAPVMLEGDPVRLEQVVWNLLSNALKFTPAGGRVEVSLRAQDGLALLQVDDTGRGLTPQQMAHLFDWADAAPSPTRQRTAGLGIGLALVHHIVQGHGGRVEARSEGEDRGSSFTVRLPLAGAPALDESPAGADAWLRGRRVLIVDGDAQAVQALRALLELEGAAAVAAGSAAEAVAAVSAQRPDFVLADLSLPDASGAELLQRLQALPQARGLPVIAVDGLGPADARQTRQAGFAAHLAKPLTLDRLVQALQSLG